MIQASMPNNLEQTSLILTKNILGIHVLVRRTTNRTCSSMIRFVCHLLMNVRNYGNRAFQFSLFVFFLLLLKKVIGHMSKKSTKKRKPF